MKRTESSEVLFSMDQMVAAVEYLRTEFFQLTRELVFELHYGDPEAGF